MLYVWFFLGLLLIIKASDIFVDSAIWIAGTFRIPEVVVGATIVSLCTVLPETMISVSASLHQNAGLAFGNSSGSIICNIAVVLAVSLLLKPLRLTHTKAIVKRLLLLLGLLILHLTVILLTGQIGRLFGAFLLLILAVYLWQSAKHSAASGVLVAPKGSLLFRLFLLLSGAGGIACGSHLLVTYGEQIAYLLGVPPMLIGLTLTAVGSSLPELVTSIASISKNAGDILVGNIIGANIMNACLVLGASAVLRPLYIDSAAAILQLGTALLFTLYLLACFLRKSKRLHRSDGLLFLIFYTFFLFFSIYLL